MRKEYFRTQVNFYLSVLFLGSFTLFMMVMIFKVAEMDNPIEDMLTATVVEANS
jgi:hypothetical protein